MAAYQLLTDSRCSERFAQLGLIPQSQQNGWTLFSLTESQKTAELRALQLAVTQERQTCLCLPVRRWKAAFFDMDSTVIAEESIVELARAAGKAREVDELTERAMAGELDFATALRTRVAMLKGLPLTTVSEVTAKLTINPGMKSFALNAKKAGLKLFLVSGGFRPLAQHIVDTLGFDGFAANDLECDEQALTGGLVGSLVDAQGKADFLEATAKKLQITLDDCLVIGDGANDLPMLQRGGAAIGYHPKAILLPHLDGANYHDHSLLSTFLTP